jgi:hypothetical protein
MVTAGEVKPRLCAYNRRKVHLYVVRIGTIHLDRSIIIAETLSVIAEKLPVIAESLSHVIADIFSVIADYSVFAKHSSHK